MHMYAKFDQNIPCGSRVKMVTNSYSYYSAHLQLCSELLTTTMPVDISRTMRNKLSNYFVGFSPSTVDLKVDILA